MKFDKRGSGELDQRNRTFSFFGNFGHGNFGNEGTLQAILYHLRRLSPDAKLQCICTGPSATATTHNIATVAVGRSFIKVRKPNNLILQALRFVFIGVPNELYRWIEAFMALKGTDVLLIPGTGLLTDSYGLRSWGPYSVFMWSFLARVRGCKLLFISVGAGPIDSSAGKWLVRSALAVADFRSYRDVETKHYLRNLSAGAANDRVYPDLAFSLPEDNLPDRQLPIGRRAIVGLGVMLYHGKLSSDSRREATYLAYLDQLVIFVRWLLEEDYDIRLLIGDLSDRPVIAEFDALLKDRLPEYDESRIIDEPPGSVGDLLEQIAETHAVIATRFHNILFALALNKPVIAISPHQKCTSLMEDVGLLRYCQDIKRLDATRLIEQFRELDENAGTVQQTIREKVTNFRAALDEQYGLIFKDILPGQNSISELRQDHFVNSTSGRESR